MLRRCSRLQVSHVQVTRSFSMPRAQATRATPDSATRPQVAHTTVSGTVQVFAAAAALCSFLNVRTWSSEPWSTTSATDRCEPGSA